LDQKPIGDGRAGSVAKALRELLEEDMHSATDRLIEVSYQTPGKPGEMKRTEGR